MDAARQIMLDEEILDAMYVKFEDLDTDFRRTEYAAESCLEKLKLFKERNGEIVHEVSVVESELPLLSSTIQRFPVSAGGGALSAQDIFTQLDQLSQRHAFLSEAVRRLDESADLDQDDGDGKAKPLETAKSRPVDPVLLKVSEGLVVRDNLEWELTEIEEKLRFLEDKTGANAWSSRSINWLIDWLIDGPVNISFD